MGGGGGGGGGEGRQKERWELEKRYRGDRRGAEGAVEREG